MLLSTTSRRLGQGGAVEGVFAFLGLLQKSKFDRVSLSFAEISDALAGPFDIPGFAARFGNLGLAAGVAHGPAWHPFFYRDGWEDCHQKALFTAIETAAACGIRDFVMHLGSVVDREGRVSTGLSRHRNLVYLRPYLRFAAARGVRIDIENGTNQPWSGDSLKEVAPATNELIAVADALNAEFGGEVLGICFDCGHARLAGGDPAGDIRRLGKRLKVVHVHDNDGGSDDHLLPGAGSIDWTSVIAALREQAYDGELCLELYYENRELDEDPVAYLNHTRHVLTKLLD